MQIISLKVDPKFLKEVERVLRLMERSGAYKGVPLTRSAVLRQAMELGLEIMKTRHQEAGEKKKGKTRRGPKRGK